MKRKDWDNYFLGMAGADDVAGRSTCLRGQVGAIVTVGNRVISHGYNGAPPGQAHCVDNGCIVVAGHCIRTIHAEVNALVMALSSTLSAHPMTLYVSRGVPCVECIKFQGALVIPGIRPGVTRVVVPEYDDYVDDRTGLFGFSSRTHMLEAIGVRVVTLSR